MPDINTYINAIKNTDNLTTGSKKQYVDNFKRLYYALDKDTFDAKKLEDYLNSKYSAMNTKTSYLNVVRWIVVTLDMPEKMSILDYFNRLVIQRDSKREERSTDKTDKEETNWINLPELIEKKEQIKSRDKRYHFILTFFTDLPPMRSDIRTVKCRNFDESKDNYYKDGVLYFNTRVKQNRDKKMSFDISFMKEFVDNYIKSHKHDYLIGRKYDSTDFSKYLGETSLKYFGKRLSIQMLRKIYLSNFYDEILPKNFDYKQLQIILKIVNHTMSTSMSYRRS